MQAAQHRGRGGDWIADGGKGKKEDKRMNKGKKRISKEAKVIDKSTLKEVDGIDRETEMLTATSSKRDTREAAAELRGPFSPGTWPQAINPTIAQSSLA